MTFTSQNMGAKKYENMSKIYRYCIIITVVIGTVMGAFGTFCSEFIVGFFSTDKDVIAIGAQRLALVMPFYVFCSLMDVAAGQLRGMGESFKPMVFSLLGACGVRLFWIYAILPLNRTLIFLYWAYPISWFVTFIIQSVLYFFVKNKILKNQKAGA